MFEDSRVEEILGDLDEESLKELARIGARSLLVNMYETIMGISRCVHGNIPTDSYERNYQSYARDFRVYGLWNDDYTRAFEMAKSGDADSKELIRLAFPG